MAPAGAGRTPTGAEALDAGGPPPREESIGDLIRRLAEDARAYAEAEFALLVALVRHRAERARRALVWLAIGWFCLFAAMTALVIGAMVRLSFAVGPLLAGIIVGVPLAIVGYLVARRGWADIKNLTADHDERAAIREVERLP